MISGTFTKKTPVPWWAAFGAPLLGVPLLVALLALGSMAHGDVGVGTSAETGAVTEQAEALQAGVEVTPVRFAESAEARS